MAIAQKTNKPAALQKKAEKRLPQASKMRFNRGDSDRLSVFARIFMHCVRRALLKSTFRKATMTLSHLTSRIGLCLAIAGAALITACGGGSDGNPSNPYDTAIVMTPSSGTALPGQPYTINIHGGQPPYYLESNYPGVLPVPVESDSDSITVFPNSVSANTAVIVWAWDKRGKGARNQAIVNVVPTMLYPSSVTVTPVGGSCGSGSSGTSDYAQICTNGLGVAAVQLTSNGTAPLSGREIEFRVIEGDFLIQSTNPGAQWQTVVSQVTDELGNARVGIKPTAAITTTQVAKIRATERATGNQVTTTFVIIGVNSALTILPKDAITLTGDGTNCPAGKTVSYSVYGGTPPYAVSFNPSSNATLSASTIANSGGSVVLTTRGGCFSSGSFIAVDATAANVSVNLTYDKGSSSGGGGSTVSTLSATPTIFGSTTSRVACTAGTVFSFTVSGGTSPYSVNVFSPTSGAVLPAVSVSGTSGVVTFTNAASPASTDYTITVTDSSAGISPRPAAVINLYCL